MHLLRARRDLEALQAELAGVAAAGAAAAAAAAAAAPHPAAACADAGVQVRGCVPAMPSASHAAAWLPPLHCGRAGINPGPPSGCRRRRRLACLLWLCRQRHQNAACPALRRWAGTPAWSMHVSAEHVALMSALCAAALAIKARSVRRCGKHTTKLCACALPCLLQALPQPAAVLEAALMEAAASRREVGAMRQQLARTQQEVQMARLGAAIAAVSPGLHAKLAGGGSSRHSWSPAPGQQGGATWRPGSASPRDVPRGGDGRLHSSLPSSPMRPRQRPSAPGSPMRSTLRVRVPGRR